VELLDCLVRAGDVSERGLRGVLRDQLRLGLAELHDLGSAALHLVHQEQEDQHDQDEREQRPDQAEQEARRRHLDVVPLGQIPGLLLLGEELDQLWALPGDPVGLDPITVGERDLEPLVAVDDLHRTGIAVLDLLHHL
jgi:hypothetical protein